jgi:hypothetical protein
MLGLTALAMALILLWGWRRPEWRIAAGVLLLSAFWLSWRSLDEYMAQIPLLALAAVLALLTNPGQKETAPDQATGEREISAELEAQPGLGGSA